MDPAFAISLQDQVEKYGAYVGIAAFFGLAVLIVLYFAQARELKRLREWAGREPERAQEAAAARAAAIVPAQPAPQPTSATATPPTASTSVTGVTAIPAAATAAGAASAAGAPVQHEAEPGVVPATEPAPPDEPETAVVEPAAEAEDASSTDPTLGVEPEKSPRPEEEPTALEPTEEPPSASEPASEPAAGNGAAGPDALPPLEPPLEPEPEREPEPEPEPERQRELAPAALAAGSRAAPRPVPVPAAAPLRATTAASARPSQRPPALTPPARRPQPLVDTGRTRTRSGRVTAVAIAGVLVTLAALVFVGTQIFGGTEEPAPRANVVSDDVTPSATTDGGASGGQPTTAENRANTTVAVFNGTTTAGLALSMAERLQSRGYPEGAKTGNFTPDPAAPDQLRATSTVYYAEGQRTQARDVGRLLAISKLEQIDGDLQGLAPEAKVLVIVGADKTG